MQNIDFYAYQSGLRQWNGGYKVLSAFLVLLLCTGLDNIVISLIVIVTMGMLNIIGNRVPLKQYIKLLKIPIAFLIMGCIPIAVGISEKPVGDYGMFFKWFYLYFSRTDIFRAVEVFFKVLGAVSAMYFMALSTPADEFINVLRKAHVPKLVVELMHMIYRFIFILTDIHGRMKRAAVSRMEYTDFRTACGSFGKIAGNLLVLSMKKADVYYDAMVSRCYEGEILFLEEKKRVTPVQTAGLAAYLMGLVLIWYIGG